MAKWKPGTFSARCYTAQKQEALQEEKEAPSLRWGLFFVARPMSNRQSRRGRFVSSQSQDPSFGFHKMKGPPGCLSNGPQPLHLGGWGLGEAAKLQTRNPTILFQSPWLLA